MPPPARPNIELCLLTASFIQCHTKETCPLFKTDVNQHWMRCRTRNTLPPWITPTKPFYQLQQKPEHNDNDTHLVILWHCWKFIKRNRETQIMTTTRVIWHSDSDTGPTASQFLQCLIDWKKNNIFCWQQGGCGLCVTDLVASHVGADVQGAPPPSPLNNVHFYYHDDCDGGDDEDVKGASVLLIMLIIT